MRGTPTKEAEIKTPKRDITPQALVGRLYAYTYIDEKDIFFINRAVELAEQYPTFPRPFPKGSESFYDFHMKILMGQACLDFLNDVSQMISEVVVTQIKEINNRRNPDTILDVLVPMLNGIDKDTLTNVLVKSEQLNRVFMRYTNNNFASLNAALERAIYLFPANPPSLRTCDNIKVGKVGSPVVGLSIRLREASDVKTVTSTKDTRETNKKTVIKELKRRINMFLENQLPANTEIFFGVLSFFSSSRQLDTNQLIALENFLEPYSALKTELAKKEPVNTNSVLPLIHNILSGIPGFLTFLSEIDTKRLSSYKYYVPLAMAAIPTMKTILIQAAQALSEADSPQHQPLSTKA